MFLHPVADLYTHWQWREARWIQRAHGLLPSVVQRTRRTSVQHGTSLCRADITSQCTSTLMALGGCKGPCNFSNACEAPELELLHPDAYDFSSDNSRTYICPTGTNYQVFCPPMDISAPAPISTNTLAPFPTGSTRVGSSSFTRSKTFGVILGSIGSFIVLVGFVSFLAYKHSQVTAGKCRKRMKSLGNYQECR
jgi:hypothetical protein